MKPEATFAWPQTKFASIASEPRRTRPMLAEAAIERALSALGKAESMSRCGWTDVPALVFSEIMRDVDLFVGVASIGNDPAWQDGGGENRYGTYWQNYSFGDLSTTAVARREILERLIPRLKIASKCVISDRFLLVQGTHRRYKIHLGSGNILMEPNDQYLCIVPDAKARAGTPQVYLPFEGDSTLSIILSKAFLLAEDGTIKDPVILRQLHS